MRPPIWVFALLALSLFATAINLPARPTSFVSDYANVLSPSERAYLEQVAVELEKNTTAELAIVTLSSLEGLPIEQYGIELAEAWKVGKKDKDNGILLILAPTEREVRVEVGYGLEGAMPDSRASRIIREKMIPHFKKDAWFEGLKAGAQAITGVVQLEAPQGIAQAREDTEGIRSFLLLWLVGCTVLFGMAYLAGGKVQPSSPWRKRLGATYGLSGVVGLYLVLMGSAFAVLLAMIVFLHIFAISFTVPHPRMRGPGGGLMYYGGAGGFRNGGSFGGGGFGGFGGGGFGGGGSSGRF